MGEAVFYNFLCLSYSDWMLGFVQVVCVFWSSGDFVLLFTGGLLGELIALEFLYNQCRRMAIDYVFFLYLSELSWPSS